jgi:GH24 family phage-related lysozyme (muramidase)
MITDAPPLVDEDIPAIRFEIPEAAPRPKPVAPPDDNYMAEARKVVRQNETSGRVYRKPYQDSKGHWTIGVGHYIAPQRLGQFRGRTLSDKEIDELFESDLQKRTAVAKRLLGEDVFARLPTPTKVAVIDGVFRGDLSGSPKALELIRQGRYDEAAVEYLNHNEYRESVRLNRSGQKHGVAGRMERNAEALRKAASQAND